MINKKNKGLRIRKKCIVQLEKLGYLIDTVEKTGRFVKQKDMFGLFDIVAIKDGEVFFIQITTNQPHVHHEYLTFVQEHKLIKSNIQQWVWYDHKNWKIWQYYITGYKRVENRVLCR